MSSEFSTNIRRLGPGDEAVAEVACRTFGAEGQLDASRLRSSTKDALLAAEEAGSIIGWVYGHQLVHPEGEATMLLYALDVVAEARGRGVGAGLVDAFVREAHEAGCTEVWVLTDDANPAALATYSSAGGRREPTPQVMVTWRLAAGRHS